MNASNSLLVGVRWSARLVALAMAGLIVVICIGEGFNPARLKPAELALAIPFFVTWIGLWLGWRWEGLGGILVVVGMAAFYVIHFAQTGFGRFPHGWAFPAIAAPGLLFLACWFWRRKARA